MLKSLTMTVARDNPMTRNRSRDPRLLDRAAA